MDEEDTPRPLRLRVVNPDPNVDVDDDRTPYIPRRKSSSSDSSSLQPRVTASDMLRRVPAAQQQTYISRDRFPIDGHDPLPEEVRRRVHPRDQAALRRPLRADPPPSNRSFLTRMFSSLAPPSSLSLRHLTATNTSSSRPARSRDYYRSSRVASSNSTNTASSSIRGTTVRRKRGNRSSDMEQPTSSDSPNPLRAPPPSLFGPRNDNSIIMESGTWTSNTSTATSRTSDSVPYMTMPVVRYPQLRFEDFCFYHTSPSQGQGENRVWIMVEVSDNLFKSRDTQGDAYIDPDFIEAANTYKGHIKSMKLDLLPMPECQILSVVGKLTSAGVDGTCSLKAWVLVRIGDEPVQPASAGAMRSEGKPTSQVIMDGILRSLKPEKKQTVACTKVLKAVVTYKQSLLPPDHRVRYHEVHTLEPAISDYPRAPDSSYESREPVARRGVYSNLLQIDLPEHADLAIELISWLQDNKDATRTAISRSEKPDVSPNATMSLLDDFSRHGTSLSDCFPTNLKNLRNEYAAMTKLAIRDESGSEPATALKRRGPFSNKGMFGRRKEDQDEAVNRARRDAVDIDRPSFEENLGLRDTTNRLRGTMDRTTANTNRPRDSVTRMDNSCRSMGLDGTTDNPDAIAMPPPLFSPLKKSASLMPDRQHMDGSTRGPVSLNTPKENAPYTRSEFDLSSTKLLRSEIMKASRRTYGSCSPSKRQQTSVYPSIEHNEPESDEAGHQKARRIWEGMRISSGGSSGSEPSTPRSIEESEEEEERARENEVLGVPWLT